MLRQEVPVLERLQGVNLRFAVGEVCVERELDDDRAWWRQRQPQRSLNILMALNASIGSFGTHKSQAFQVHTGQSVISPLTSLTQRNIQKRTTCLTLIYQTQLNCIYQTQLCQGHRSQFVVSSIGLLKEFQLPLAPPQNEQVSMLHAFYFGTY